MTRLHQHRIGRRTGATLSAGLALLAVAAIAPVSANAAACTQTITGTNNGVINVAAPNKLCLVDAVQTGAVNVAPNAGLSVLRSTINGAVTLSSGYTELQFCGSRTVIGAIVATGDRRRSDTRRQQGGRDPERERHRRCRHRQRQQGDYNDLRQRHRGRTDLHHQRAGSRQWRREQHSGRRPLRPDLPQPDVLTTPALASTRTAG
jgi:hypothetical protein